MRLGNHSGAAKLFISVIGHFYSGAQALLAESITNSLPEENKKGSQKRFAEAGRPPAAQMLDLDRPTSHFKAPAIIGVTALEQAPPPVFWFHLGTGRRGETGRPPSGSWTFFRHNSILHQPRTAGKAINARAAGARGCSKFNWRSPPRTWDCESHPGVIKFIVGHWSCAWGVKGEKCKAPGNCRAVNHQFLRSNES